MFPVRLHPADERALRFVVDRAVFEHSLTHLRCRSSGLVVRHADGRFNQGGDWRFSHREIGDVVFFPSRRKEDDAQPLAARSPGPPAAVEEDLGVCGRVELDDEIDLRDIEAAGGDVGC